MKILISNDDGYQAQGILTLARVLSEFSSDVVIFAPNENRSASSYAISRGSIQVEQVSSRVYKVFGTPSDCLLIALRGFFDWRPDFVFSGINLGANLATDVIYSGTIAAAKQAFWEGIPSVAFSLCGNASHFGTAEHVVRSFFKHYFSSVSPDRPSCLSLNIPPVSTSSWKGFAYSSLGRRKPLSPTEVKQENAVRYSCLLGKVGDFCHMSPTQDCWAIQNGYASITSLNFSFFDEDSSFYDASWMVQLSDMDT